jgi:hypothetical protein
MATFVSATLSTTATKTGVVIAAGQSLIILAMDGFAASETLTISDGTNIYVSRGTRNETLNGQTYTLIDSLSPTPGTYTLTLSGGAGGGPQFLILIYSGGLTYSAGSFASYDSSGSPVFTTDGSTTAAITPTAYPALIVGLSSAGNGSAMTAGTGFTSRFAFGSSGFQNYAEDLTISSGSHIASFTATAGSAAIVVLGAAYLPSAPAPFAPILLDDSGHSTGGSDQINMGTGPGTGTGTGDTAQVAFTKLKQWAADLNTVQAQLFPVRSLQTPVTGFSIATTVGVTLLVLNPAGTLASGSITLPQGPADNQPFMIMTRQTITALTVNTADTSTLSAAPTTLAANTSVKWRFMASLNTWFKE